MVFFYIIFGFVIKKRGRKMSMIEAHKKKDITAFRVDYIVYITNRYTMTRKDTSVSFPFFFLKKK